MRGFLIDPELYIYKPIDVPEHNQLQEIYEIIHCDCIDITGCVINGITYKVICDDMGLYKDEIKWSIYRSNNDLIAGAVIITGVEDQEGNLTDLTNYDIHNIANNLIHYKDQVVLVAAG